MYTKYNLIIILYISSELGIYGIHFTPLGFNKCSNVLMSQVLIDTVE